MGLIVNPSDSLSVTLQALVIAPAIPVPVIVPAFLNVSHTVALAGSVDGQYEVVVVS